MVVYGDSYTCRRIKYLSVLHLTPSRFLPHLTNLRKYPLFLFFFVNRQGRESLLFSSSSGSCGDYWGFVLLKDI